MYRAKRFGWKHQNFEKRIKQIILRKIKEILGIGLLFLLSITTALGQGPSLSPYDLKESYLEKKLQKDLLIQEIIGRKGITTVGILERDLTQKTPYKKLIF